MGRSRTSAQIIIYYFVLLMTSWKYAQNPQCDVLMASLHLTRHVVLSKYRKKEKQCDKLAGVIYSEQVNNRCQQLEDLILKNGLFLFNDKSRTYFHSATGRKEGRECFI